jgi:hypothetical protein
MRCIFDNFEARIVMREEIADAVLDKVKHFTVGFGRAGDEPAAKGSGVLIKHGELHGILTCAHVDKFFSYAAGDEPWIIGGEDIAFIHLPLHLIGNIARDCAFLDAEKNFTKPEPDDRSLLIAAHSIFGLVEEFTGATTRQDGRATTLLKGVLTSGVVRDVDALNATLECFEENRANLPGSFGGSSGGGLWRVYVRKREDGSFEGVHHRLIGIATQEIKGSPHRITCQGMGRVGGMLEGVRRGMGEKR